MSREPRKMEENARGNGKLIIYIAVSIIIAIVIVSYILIANMIEAKAEEQRLSEIENVNKEQNQTLLSEMPDDNDGEDSESVSTQIGKSVEESEKLNENNAVNITTTQKNDETKQNTDTVTTNTEEKNTQPEETNTQEQNKKEITFNMPVDGDIVKGFAKDNLVYSETLQEWIVHQAIDIKANSRDVVKAAADGTVTAIKNDPRYGLTVIIEHEGGFKTVYSNLLTAEFVVEGENVKQGQTLGTVGSSAIFEIADEPHLHFEMLKDSVYVDPTIYIK